MKTLQIISIVLGIILITSCNKEEPKPQTKSLIGTWEFTSSSTSGEFIIAKIGNKIKVNSGNFTVEGINYTIDVSTDTEEVIALTSNEITLYLIDYQVSTDYNSINSEQLNFYVPGEITKIFYETVTCNRK